MTLPAYARASRPLVVMPVVFVGVFAAWPTITTLRRGGNVVGALGDGSLWSTVWFTSWQALVSTAITLLLGVPVTWLLSRHEFVGRRTLRALTLVPFVLPTLVVGLAFRAVLPGALHVGTGALITAHVFLNVAVVVRIVGARWESQPYSFEEAASTLAAGPTARFVTVTWPMLRGSIAAAGGLVFMYCFSTYGAARVLAGPSNPVVETEIYRFAVLAGDMRAASALAIAQIVLVAVVLALTSRDTTLYSTPATPRHIATLPVRHRIAIRCGAVLIAGLFCVPLVGLGLRSMRIGGSFSLVAWRTAFNGSATSAHLGRAMWSTASTAIVAMIVAVVIGAAIAFVRVHSRSRFVRAAATACEIVPVVVSAVIVGLGLILTFRDGFFDWRGSRWLLPVAHAIVALPLVSRTLASALRQIPGELRHAASTLGASPWHVARSVDAALLRKPVAAAASLAALVSVGEFGASSLLSRRGGETMTMAIGRLLGRPGDLVAAQAFVVATVLGLACLVLVTFVDLFAAGDAKR